jgi:hypothetical protein
MSGTVARKKVVDTGDGENKSGKVAKVGQKVWVGPGWGWDGGWRTGLIVWAFGGKGKKGHVFCDARFVGPIRGTRPST